MSYWKKELIHAGFGIVCAVIVAVAGQVAGAEITFDQTFLVGLGVTALRSFATALITVLSPYVLSSRTTEEV